MVTNKALSQLGVWARNAIEGHGEAARYELETFAHIGQGLIASIEFQEKCKELFGRKFEPSDFDCTVKILDAIANIEVRQVKTYGPAPTST